MPRSSPLRPLAALLAVVVLGACAATPSAGQDVPVPVSAGPILTDPVSTASAFATPLPTQSLAPNVPLYLVDVNTTDDLGLSLPMGVLSGVVGTIPGAPVSQAFRDSLRQVDPTLVSDAYAAEAYDAVILAALGALAAQSDAGRAMAGQLVPLTNGDTPCVDFAECRDILARGESVAYQGRSGPLRLSDAGEPTVATIGVYTFGPDNRLLPDVEYVDVPVPATKAGAAPAGTEQPGAGDDVLTIGTLLPESGSLSFMRPAQLAGVQRAVVDIEAAGGIAGIDRIELVDADSGEDAQTAAAGLRRLLKGRVDVIVGAGAATTAGGIVPAATEAGVLYLAPVNSSLTQAGARFQGLYWRMSPSSLAQGTLLADRIAADGHDAVAIIHSDDDYAAALAQAVRAAVRRSGGSVVADVGYTASSVDFAAPVAKVKKANPDAIVLVGFDESAQLVFELVQQGIGPNSVG